MLDLTNDGLGKAVFPHILAVPVEAQNDFSIDDDDGNRRSFECPCNIPMAYILYYI